MEKQGLVISYFGNSVAVEDEKRQLFQCHLHRNQELPVVGDRVKWLLAGDQTGTITSIEPRRSLLARDNGRGKKKILAANIDALLIVMTPPPIFSEHLVDRYMVAAELLNIEPILVLNKADLLNDVTRSPALARLKAYRQIPYAVVLSSTTDVDGLDALKALLKDKTAVLVGPSGVGKSSIITALGDGEIIRTTPVSPKGAGKHTTTATRLYHLPQGGNLIDSPGVREFNLWPVTTQEVLRGYKEFQPFLTGCKFRNCQHGVEPDCEVQRGLASGKISPQRFASYHELIKEVTLRNNKY